MGNTMTTVRLLAVPLENDYKHTFYFQNDIAQANYFSSKVVKVANNCSYQRKEKMIRFPAFIESIERCNYVMYNNGEHSAKWYYAFITKMEYKNDEMTEIYIETDVMQTWLRNNDYTIKTSFIEREHVDSDIVGEHTIPEGLDTGEYISNAKITNEELQDVSLVIGCTIDINDYTNQADDWNSTKEFKATYGTHYNGLFSGLKYYVISASNLKTVMKHIAYEGQEDAVQTLFYAPTNFIEMGTAGKYATEINGSLHVKNKPWVVGSKPTMLDGYTPRNKKLLTAPFQYLLVDNGGGGACEYMYEKFDDDTLQFNVYSVLTSGMSIRAVPTNYNGALLNDSEGINLSKYSICSWVSDAYTSWLTQSAVNVGLTTAGAIIATVGAVALTPATAGASLAIGASVAGGSLAVASSLANANERLSIPPQIHGNTNSGDVSVAKGDVTFRAYKMSIRKEYAKIIDGYFDMYGYKTNRVGIPSFAHRENYWYIKTIDVNIDADLPMEDLQKIKACYNNGITFWDNPSNIGNYSVSNECTG